MKMFRVDNWMPMKKQWAGYKRQWRKVYTIKLKISEKK